MAGLSKDDNKEMKTEYIRKAPLPEILAPAGSRKAFLGAMKAGADAVYLGGEKFGARAYAENFSRDDIVKSIREAHILGKRVYLTLNVLTKESELEETVEFASDLYDEGLDGAIVQDIGVLASLHERCPGLALHASTQMSVTSAESVRFLKGMGVRRVVPARELSLSEIKALKREEPIEVESFIHGAMCYAYSGRCLMSSFLGGRSGNRGRCAGTCRLPYRILDNTGRSIRLQKGPDMPYPLSMRDMCVLEILPDLIDAGIDSFKIEGRMKSPHYAAGVTALYRKYTDRYVKWDADGRKTPWKVEPEDMKQLASLYIRSDLSTGYYYRQNGRELLTIGKPGYAGTEDSLLLQIEQKYLQEMPKREIAGRAVFMPGEPAALTVFTPDSAENGSRVQVQVLGDIVQPAQKRPMGSEEIEKRLRKTGDSIFTFGDLSVEVQGDIFLPVASLNALRRDAMQALEEKILADTNAAEGEATACAGFRKEESDTGSAVGAGVMSSDPIETGADIPEIWAVVTTLPQLRAAKRCGVKNIVVEETPQLTEVMTEAERAEYFAALPHVFRKNSRNAVKNLIGKGFRGVLVRNLEEITFLRQCGYTGQVIADSSLYQWNTVARDILLDQCDKINLGWELSGRDMQPLLKGAGKRQLLNVYGRIPMMITAGCVKKTAGVCSHTEKEFFYLEDRKGIRFPVRCICGSCSNVIYNSLPQSLHTFAARRDPIVMGAGGWLCTFTTESGEDAEAVLRWYLAAAAGDAAKSNAESVFGEYTTGHYRKSAL